MNIRVAYIPNSWRLILALILSFGLSGLQPVQSIQAANLTSAVLSSTVKLDVVLVIDTSESMTFDAATDDPMRDPSQCNTIHNCHPFEDVKQAAKAFVEGLNFPDDRVSIVTFNDSARVDLGFSTDKTEVQAVINGLGVVEPEICDTASGPCREYERDVQGNIIDLDGDGIGDHYLGFSCPVFFLTGNPSTCGTTAIGQGLFIAGNELANQDTFREDARRVVIILSDGAANAPSFVCPHGTWEGSPFCRDLQLSRHCSEVDDAFCLAAGGVYDPENYDADDYARDMADLVSEDQGAQIYTIGLGDLVRTSQPRAQISNPDQLCGSSDPIDECIGAGEQLLRYAAEIGSGAYYFAPSANDLDEIFQDIFSNLSSDLEPLGHWKFDESSWAGDCSTADILDSSGNGHHGIACIDGGAPYPVPGVFGNAGRFDGIYQYADMGPGFNFTSSFTASVWIALDDYDWCGPTGASQHIIGTHHLRTPTGNGRGWGIYWDCDGIAWELTNNTGSAIGSYGFFKPSPFPENGSWHHTALVYDSTVPSATLYWDGVPVYSESGTANVPSFLFDNGEPLTVNGLPYAPSAGAPGKIDDTRVYDRALSAAKIQTLYDYLPPLAVDDSYGTDEDTSLNIAVPGLLGNDSDPDGNPLTAVKVTDPANGTLNLNTDGSFTYTPDENYFGADSFTYKANDGTWDSEVAIVTITVNPVNDPPVANNDIGTVDQGGTLNVSAPGILANDSDLENDILLVNTTPVTPPVNGSLTLNADGSYTYIHDGSETTTDNFMYEILDGNGGTDTATVNITITAVNDAPIAMDDNATTSEDTAVIIDVLSNDSDVDGDSLVVESVTQSSNGTVTNHGANVSYKPAANFNGTDSFSYTVSDGNGGMDTATVGLTITAVNDPPTALDNTYATDEDTPLSTAAPGVLANDSDVDGDTLTSVLNTAPANGSLTLNADGSFDYIPHTNFTGSDNFTYLANDGTANSAVATVNITVYAVNDAPTAVDDAYSMDEDTILNVAGLGVLSNDTDADGDLLSAVLNAGPSNGNLTLNTDGSFTYIPIANFNGTDTFNYITNDGTTNSSVATVTLTVNAVNDPPVADDDNGTIAQAGTLTVSAPGVLANDTDPENDTLTVNTSPVTPPANGSLILNADGSYIYIHDGSETTNDNFVYEISDGNGGMDTATVNLIITAVNDSPVAVDDNATTSEDTVVIIDVLANDSDVDGDTLMIESVTQGSNGTVTNNGTNVAYTPTTNFNGSDSFTYIVSDGNGGTDMATVELTITAVNDPPTVNISAPSDGSSFTESDFISFTGTASDVEDGNLTLNLVWSSNLDGSIGTGASFSTSTLSVGTHIVTAVVNDFDALEGSDLITITVTPAATIVDAFANGEISVAGTLNGSYISTHDDDGNLESITERESGGKPQNRYSYLEHKWTFNITPGNTATVYANAWSGGSNDDDSFIFAYSMNDVDYIEMFIVDNTSEDNQIETYVLPPSIQGIVYLRVTDSNHNSGNRALDTIYIDNLYIRSETQPGIPPDAPSGLVATSTSATHIDLTWIDNANDETGFYIERSLNGTDWFQIDVTNENVTTYSDITVFPAIQYYYRVRAYNGSGSSAYSNIAMTITPAGISLSAQGYKVKGVQTVDLLWSGDPQIFYDVYRDGGLIGGPVLGNTLTDNIGLKGGGSYEYQVCEAGSTANCSNIIQVDF